MIKNKELDKGLFGKYFARWTISNEKIKQKEEELIAFKNWHEILNNILEAVNGLRKTKKQSKDKSYDPGKSDSSYYYVKHMNKSEIIAAKDFKIHQFAICDKCKKQAALLMSYSQTYDSAEGDTWETQAFIICCDELQIIQYFTESDRFLKIE